MSIVEKAISWMESLANDNTHGYDQAYRWGPDYDCSSAVITAWEYAGVPVKTKGATYTGNIYSVFKSCGFKDVTDQVDLDTGAGMKRGDVLLNHVNHVAMFCGSGMKVEASINEFGGITGGESGDQTGNEIRICSYSNYWAGWNAVLRYNESSSSTSSTTNSKSDSSGIAVNTTGTLSKKVKFTGIVTDDDPNGLNCRQWAGIEYQTCRSIGPFLKGTKLGVCDTILASDKSLWHYVKYDGKYGFVCADYVSKA